MRTKERVFHALLELLKEKDIESVTVSELIKAAGVSRSSYYYHFYRPESVLEEMTAAFIERYREILDSVGREPEGGPTAEEAGLELARHFYAHQDLVSRLFSLKLHDRFVPELIRAYITSFEKCEVYAGVREECAAPQDEVFSGLYVYSLSYAFIGRMEWWAKNGFALEPEELMRYSGEVTERMRSCGIRRRADYYG